MFNNRLLDAPQGAVEKLIYSSFLLDYVVRFPAHVGRKFIPYSFESDFVLPNNSVLHTLHNLLKPTRLTGLIDIDKTDPIIFKEKNRVYVNSVVIPPSDSSVPFPSVEKFIYMPSKYTSQVMSFFANNKEFTRPLSVEALNNRQNILLVSNYNALLQIRFSAGVTTEYKLIDIVLRSILNNIHMSPERLHFIEIPLSNEIYPYYLFKRGYEKLDRLSIQNRSDLSYFFILQFLGFIAESTNSLFTQIQSEILKNTHIIFTHRDRCVVYNLDTLKHMNDKNLALKLFSHITLLKKPELVDSLSDDQLISLAETTDSSGDISLDNAPVQDDVVLSDISAENKPFSIHTTYKPTYVDLIDSAKLYIDSAADITPAQQQRAKMLLEKQLNISFSGKTIKEYLLNLDTLSKLSNSKLELPETLVPDRSMLKSSLESFDSDYIQNQMSSDIISSIVSFSKNGLFITSIDETDKIDPLNRVKSVRIGMSDVYGRSHTISFSYPIVNESGVFLVNGVESKMIKQQVTLPICKVSPNRVNLSSSFNKTIVERHQSRINSFPTYILRYISDLKKAHTVETSYGTGTVGKDTPYDYAAICGTYARIDFLSSATSLVFDYKVRHNQITPENLPTILEEERRYGTYLGADGKTRYYISKDNVVYRISNDGDVVETTIIQLFSELSGVAPKPVPFEYVDLKIRDANLPIIFVLGYKYGLTKSLEYIGAGYKFVPIGSSTKVTKKESLLSIKFKDGVLYFDRYPLTKSLILSGLRKFDHSDISFLDMDSEDTYYQILSQNMISTNYIKSIDTFFKFFIDPITESVLRSMGEPTNVRDLLIRATEMLSDTHSIASSSMKNHRLRGYERFASILYNETSRALDMHHSQNNRRGISINPQAVFQRIVQDPTVMTYDLINPVHDAKMTSAFTYSGQGGRSAESFVVKDRVYPSDGVGIISECTPDSGKVGLNAYMTGDPRISNIRGMYTDVDVEELAPTQVLSNTSLLLPGSTNDDPKRANFISIQLSHHVPSEAAECGYVRTGYETVLAHRCGDAFSYIAKEDGRIVKIDKDNGVMIIEYASSTDHSGKMTMGLSDATWKNIRGKKIKFVFLSDGSEMSYSRTNGVPTIGDIILVDNQHPVQIIDELHLSDLTTLPSEVVNSQASISELSNKLTSGKLDKVVGYRFSAVDIEHNTDVVQFGDKYTAVSGTYVKQALRTLVDIGPVKKGDVLIYNSGFFEPIYGTRQVAWKHGVLANIALLDTGLTIEDSCVISRDFGKVMKTDTAHIRTISIDANTIIHKFVSIGDVVETTDPLGVVENAEASTILDIDGDMSTDIIATLDQVSPKAKYHGTVVQIRIIRSCELSQMHPTLREFVTLHEAKENNLAKIAKGTMKNDTIMHTHIVSSGTKYMGVEFDNSTVLILVTINTELECGQGDKVCFVSANKSVVGGVAEKPIVAVEDGTIIDAMFGGMSVSNRIVLSPLTVGAASRVLSGLQSKILAIYKEK
jgi:hypothetical protein